MHGWEKGGNVQKTACTQLYLTTESRMTWENLKHCSFPEKLIYKSLLAIVEKISPTLHNMHSKKKYGFCWKKSALRSCLLRMRWKFQNPEQAFGDNSTASYMQKAKGIELLVTKLNTAEDQTEMKNDVSFYGN